MREKKGRLSSEAKRATIFAFILVGLGIFNLYFIIFKPQLHPQLILFFYSIPATAAISLFSMEAVLIHYGSLQPLLVSALTATAGTTVAGFLDWHIFVPLLNWRKIEAYRRSRLYKMGIHLFNKAPFFVLLIASFIPMPFFPFKFLAFSARYSFWKYLAARAIARLPRYYLFIWLGHNVNIPGWALILLFLAMLLVGLWKIARGRIVE
jgi:membrane protein YqaA with SNARE-associated domain